MPYVPTGRPNGRPRKHPVEEVFEQAVQATAESSEEPKRPAVPPRARARFRQIAEALNPSPFIVMRDARGRPRHAPRHSSVKV